jgi:hypothetical protein
MAASSTSSSQDVEVELLYRAITGFQIKKVLDKYRLWQSVPNKDPKYWQQVEKRLIGGGITLKLGEQIAEEGLETGESDTIRRYVGTWQARDHAEDVAIGEKLWDALRQFDRLVVREEDQPPADQGLTSDASWPASGPEWDLYGQLLKDEGVPDYVIFAVTQRDRSSFPTYIYFNIQRMSGLSQRELNYKQAREKLDLYYAKEGPEVEELDAQRVVHSIDQFGGLPFQGSRLQWRMLARYMYYNGVPHILVQTIYLGGVTNTTANPVVEQMWLRAGRDLEDIHYVRDLPDTDWVNGTGITPLDKAATGQIVRDVVEDWRAKNGGYLPSIDDQDSWRDLVRDLNKFYVDNDLTRHIYNDAVDVGVLMRLNQILMEAGAAPEIDFEEDGEEEVDRDNYYDNSPTSGVRRFYLYSISQIRHAYADGYLTEAQYLEAVRLFQEGEEIYEIPLRR